MSVSVFRRGAFRNQINKSVFPYSGLNSVTNTEEYGRIRRVHRSDTVLHDYFNTNCKVVLARSNNWRLHKVNKKSSETLSSSATVPSSSAIPAIYG